MNTQTLSTWTRENPLAAGALALAVGVIAGLIAPRTEAEDRAFGPMRDALFERAGEAALELSQSVTDEVREAAKQALAIDRSAAPRFWASASQAS
ncbi:MAG: hypothetical protein ABI665_16185 [Vicinamibacterales bacterium]